MVEIFRNVIRIELQPLPCPYDIKIMWAKCDMIATVCYQRFGAKLKRGTFAATFLLACIAALEMEGVRLEDI
jgi:uncharacterized protein YifN (PemK superfamily)